MKTFKFLLFACLLTILFTSCQTKKAENNNIVIMLSVDGFRWDYPDLYPTPNLDKIEAQGVKAKSLIPCFPSKTFPNHYSIATGLYPDHHGLVNNTYYDPDRETIYKIGDRTKVEDGYYYGGEPIWVTAEKQDVHTASFFWVGSEAEINGYRPGIWKKFDSSVPYTTRLDSVISWLEMPEKTRPRLITWYIEEPDGVGHKYGPESIQTGAMIQKLDSIIGIFIDKTNDLANKDLMNIIITSDHGMGEIKGEKYVNVLDNIPNVWVKRSLGYNPVLFVDANEGYIDSINNTLKDIQHISCWKKDEIPEHLNYGSNKRISDLVIAADSGWSIGFKDVEKTGIGGTHGYDISNSDMHAIFYASGPDFKNDYQQESFYNIDIYPLICEILDIKPEEVDGNLSRVSGMLKK